MRRSALSAVAGTRRNPDAAALMRVLTPIGNNVNQLTRYANSTGSMPEAHELQAVLELLKQAIARVIDL